MQSVDANSTSWQQIIIVLSHLGSLVLQKFVSIALRMLIIMEPNFILQGSSTGLSTSPTRTASGSSQEVDRRWTASNQHRHQCQPRHPPLHLHQRWYERRHQSQHQRRNQRRKQRRHKRRHHQLRRIKLKQRLSHLCPMRRRRSSCRRTSTSASGLAWRVTDESTKS